MFSQHDAPRGSHSGGRRGRGGRSTSRRSQQRSQARRLRAAAAEAPPAAAGRVRFVEEEGETPHTQTHAGPGPNPQTYAQAAAPRPRTHYSTDRDPAVPQPFHSPKHLLVTGTYSHGNATPNELLFYGFFEPGVAATRELLQMLRKEVHKEVDDQFHIKLPPPNDADDVITVVTRRDLDKDQAALWVLTGDVRIRFASPDQARAVYHRQRGQRAGNNNGCLYTVDSQRCTVKIPDGTSRIPPDDRDLHRLFLGCDAFRHEGQLAVESLLRQSLARLWIQITQARYLNFKYLA